MGEAPLARFREGFAERFDAEARLFGALVPGNRSALHARMRTATLLFAWAPRRIIGLRHWADRVSWIVEEGEYAWSVQALEASVWARRVLRGEATLCEALGAQTPVEDEGAWLADLATIAGRPAPEHFAALDEWLVRVRRSAAP